MNAFCQRGTDQGTDYTSEGMSNISPLILLHVNLTATHAAAGIESQACNIQVIILHTCTDFGRLPLIVMRFPRHN